MASIPKYNKIHRGNSKVDGVYHTAEWLLTSFAGVLVFIVFVMQVYRIPTGSMAPTLRGAHFRLRCPQCGYAYGHDYIARNYGINNSAYIPSQKVVLGPRYAGSGRYESKSSQCPNCGFAKPDPVPARDGNYYIREGNELVPVERQTVFKGDQIFVMKSIYQFFKPKRWDVIVFKNPVEPRINYIKRCIGLPNETIIIVDGDVYADGVIQRKPEKVQEELWMTLYDNNHQPIHPEQSVYGGHAWEQPFEKVSGSAWNLYAEGPTVFSLDSQSKTYERLRYNDQNSNGFLSTYAYDDPRSYTRMPVCSDLMVQYYLDMKAGSAAGAQIQKYGIIYQGIVHADGRMEIVRIAGGKAILEQEDKCNPEDLQIISRFRFATLDHQVILEYGSTKLVYDLGTGVDDAGTNRAVKPEVQILGYGNLRLTGVGLFRDIHYISEPEAMNVLRGTQDDPMVLEDDQYFACGDNSPFSADSRIWETAGLGNNGQTYPPGVVPKEYLVGKGLVVHWPGGYRLANEPIRWIPNVDDMKIIYGGK